MQLTLDEFCGHLRNYFDCVRRSGEYTIENGQLDLDFVQNGQYFRIVGSVFNDGVYQAPATGLHDETFTGSVWALKLPPDFIALYTECNDWAAKYGDGAAGPYLSESFAGYSYTKATSGDGRTVSTWAEAFKTRLNRYRKL